MILMVPLAPVQLRLNGIGTLQNLLVVLRPGREQNVLWLDVPVDHAVRVQVHQQAEQGLDHFCGAPPLVAVHAVQAPFLAAALAAALEVVLLAQGKGLDHALPQLPVQVALRLLLLHQVIARPVLKGSEERNDVHALGVRPVNVHLPPHVPVVDILHPLLVVHLHDHHGHFVLESPGRVLLLLLGGVKATALPYLPHHAVALPVIALAMVVGLEDHGSEDLGHLAGGEKLDRLEGLARPVVFRDGLQDVPRANLRRERQGWARCRLRLDVGRRGGVHVDQQLNQ
mmetsp:Transcript_10111/g.28636  ORF Transcript_10111/g.28636 Transcript_10111/m.28636 type:complete len:284 (+) Transcript_10111:914-1765(+)